MASVTQVLTRGGGRDFVVRVQAGPHVFVADEPLDLGGSDLGPNPYELLLAALGS